MKKLFASLILFAIMAATAYADYWEQKIIPNSGNYILGIRVFGNNLYRATQNDGVHKSTDGGITWVGYSNGIRGYKNMHGLEIHNNQLWACSYGYGVYVLNTSTNTWEERSTGLPSTYKVWHLCSAGNNLVAGCWSPDANEIGTYVTTNNGTSWTRTCTASMNDFVYASGELWGSSQNYCYKSTDGGLTWTNVTGMGYPAIQSIARAGTSQNLVVGSNNGVVCVSTNNGSTWTTRAIPGCTNNVMSLVALNTVNGVYIAAGTSGSGVYYSENAGVTWTKIERIGMKNQQCWTMYYPNTYFEGELSLFVGTNGKGIFKTNLSDAEFGYVWNTTFRRTNAIGGYGPTLTKMGSYYYIASVGCPGYPGIYRTSLDFSTSEAVYLPQSANTITTQGTNILAGAYNNTSSYSPVLVSTNGTTWTGKGSWTQGVEYLYANSSAIWAFKGMYYGSTSSKSTDGGTTWTNYTYPGGIMAMDVVSPTETFMLLQTNYPNNYYICNLYKNNSSGDCGHSGVVAVGGLTSDYYTSVRKFGSYVIVTSQSNGVFISTNSGTSFTQRNSGLPVSGMGYYPNLISSYMLGTVMYLGSVDGQVFKSTDYGMNWTSLSDQLPDCRIENFMADGTRLFATSYDGIFELKSGTAPRLPDVAESMYYPDSVQIAESNAQSNVISPNPAETYVDVKADFNEEGSITVTIYDLMNEKVVRFERPSSKSINERVDVSSFVAGSYFAVIENGKERFTCKFIKK